MLEIYLQFPLWRKKPIEDRALESWNFICSANLFSWTKKKNGFFSLIYACQTTDSQGNPAKPKKLENDRNMCK